MKSLRLTTIGRQTGRAHSVRLYALPHGGSWVVVASNGGKVHNPDWYLNLRSNPDVEVVTPPGETLKAVARDATDVERGELWPRVVEAFVHHARFQRKTEREIPIVILEPVAAANAELPDQRKRRAMPKLGGAAIGSAMAALDAAIFKTLPPPIEVVEKNRHDGAMVTSDGTRLTITLPEAVVSMEPEPEESPPTDE